MKLEISDRYKTSATKRTRVPRSPRPTATILAAVPENEPALLSELLGKIIAWSSQIWEIIGQIEISCYFSTRAIYTNQKKKIIV